jgi:hypothetical protein
MNCPTCGRPLKKKDAWLLIEDERAQDFIFKIVPSDDDNTSKVSIKRQTNEWTDMLKHINENNLKVTKCSFRLFASGTYAENCKMSNAAIQALSAVAPELEMLRFQCEGYSTDVPKDSFFRSYRSTDPPPVPDPPSVNEAWQQTVWRQLEKISFPLVQNAYLDLQYARSAAHINDPGFTIASGMFSNSTTVYINQSKWLDKPLVVSGRLTKKWASEDRRDQVWEKTRLVFGY